VSDSRSDRPTNSEYGKAAEADQSTARSSTTVRSGVEEQPTLRLGSGGTEHELLPAWRSRYDDQGELARGGMSSIRSVYDRVMKRRVAMKVYDRERDPSGLPHFVEEARITGQLDHPNIVPVHDVQSDEGGQPTRFTMKLVQGETLADILDQSAPAGLQGQDLERMLSVFVKVCDAVSFAHSRGVIHCDLKPSNVLIGSHGQVYVMDWGVALRRDRPVTAPEPIHERPTTPYGSGLLSGTPAYMAPEQAYGRREEIDERTDVFGLGGMLYAALTLSPPYNGGNASADLELAKRGFVRPPESLVRDRPIPPGLRSIVMRALAHDPAQRYPTVEALKLDVEAFLRGGGWFETLRVPRGTVVINEGDAPDAAYILVEGQCELYRVVFGHKRFMRMLSAGEVFGETSILGSSTRTASIAASTDVTLVRVTREALERELERTGWMRAFIEAVAQRFIELDRKVRELEERG
jgi:serine/threonine-protein kinase